MDVREFLHRSCPDHPTVWVRDTSGGPLHYADWGGGGGVPAQGGTADIGEGALAVYGGDMGVTSSGGYDKDGRN